MRGPYPYLKRGLDVLLSAILLCLGLLPMGIIALLIAANSAGGVIFRQQRIGREGRPFVCYKFRTMVAEAPEDRPTGAFPEAERYVTAVGRLLRKSSLDELPQLWNVLRGDMSLVGPRPLIPAEEEVHRLRERCGVYRIRPGMTGLSQIRGRDLLSDAEKARWDSRYAHSVSLPFDCRILWETALRVATGRNVSSCRSSRKARIEKEPTRE